MISGTVTTRDITQCPTPSKDSTEISGIVRVKTNVYGQANINDTQAQEVMFLHSNQFPEVGSIKILYVDVDTDHIYRWDGAMYRTLSCLVEDIAVAKTTAEWETQTSYISRKGVLYIYLDHRVQDGQNIPGVKIGDGNAYVVDLPFACAGVTDKDIENWNNKVSVKISDVDTENIIFYTN